MYSIGDLFRLTLHRRSGPPHTTIALWGRNPRWGINPHPPRHRPSPRYTLIPDGSVGIILETGEAYVKVLVNGHVGWIYDEWCVNLIKIENE